MANLRGVIRSDKSECSRLSSRVIQSTLNTHGGRVETVLSKDGKYRVYVNGIFVTAGDVNVEGVV